MDHPTNDFHRHTFEELLANSVYPDSNNVVEIDKHSKLNPEAIRVCTRVKNLAIYHHKITYEMAEAIRDNVSIRTLFLSEKGQFSGETLRILQCRPFPGLCVFDINMNCILNIPHNNTFFTRKLFPVGTYVRVQGEVDTHIVTDNKSSRAHIKNLWTHKVQVYNKRRLIQALPITKYIQQNKLKQSYLWASDKGMVWKFRGNANIALGMNSVPREVEIKEIPYTHIQGIEQCTVVRCLRIRGSIRTCDRDFACDLAWAIKNSVSIRYLYVYNINEKCLQILSMRKFPDLRVYVFDGFKDSRKTWKMVINKKEDTTYFSKIPFYIGDIVHVKDNPDVHEVLWNGRNHVKLLNIENHKIYKTAKKLIVRVKYMLKKIDQDTLNYTHMRPFFRGKLAPPISEEDEVPTYTPTYIEKWGHETFHHKI